MTNREIKSYVFKHTAHFEIIKNVTERYLDFYKEIGINASDIMKFTAANAPAIVTDRKSNNTIIQPGGGDRGSIIQIVNDKLTIGYKCDVTEAVAYSIRRDVLRKKLERKDIRAAKRANAKERLERRRKAAKERREALFKLREGAPRNGIRKLLFFLSPIKAGKTLPEPVSKEAVTAADTNPPALRPPRKRITTAAQTPPKEAVTATADTNPPAPRNGAEPRLTARNNAPAAEPKQQVLNINNLR
jgi:hypothetical protein